MPRHGYGCSSSTITSCSARAVRAELGDAIEVVGEADDVGPAIELIAERLPDVVLLDLHLPSGGGQLVIEAVRALAGEPGDSAAGAIVKFLALSVSDAPEDVIAVIRAGARGYVTKTIWDLSSSMPSTGVAGGDVVFSPRLAGFVLDAFAAMPGEAPGCRSRARPAHTTRA